MISEVVCSPGTTELKGRALVRFTPKNWGLGITYSIRDDFILNNVGKLMFFKNDNEF